MGRKAELKKLSRRGARADKARQGEKKRNPGQSSTEREKSEEQTQATGEKQRSARRARGLISRQSNPQSETRGESGERGPYVLDGFLLLSLARHSMW